MLDIVANYHCRQFQGTLKIQTEENGEKPHLGPNLGTLSPNSGCQNFFPKILLRPVTRYHGQLSCTTSGKTNDPILRKFSNRWVDGPEDTDNKSDSIGCCPTNVERPATFDNIFL